mmetsp:Transcript_18402/g.58398  ORF Transcript_18402/g.58398 Transcript_18402/m.58398 type:complete len:238 (+) Transcript_18402:81-794(+)
MVASSPWWRAQARPLLLALHLCHLQGLAALRAAPSVASAAAASEQAEENQRRISTRRQELDREAKTLGGGREVWLVDSPPPVLAPCSLTRAPKHEEHSGQAMLLQQSSGSKLQHTILAGGAAPKSDDAELDSSVATSHPASAAKGLQVEQPTLSPEDPGKIEKGLGEIPSKKQGLFVLTDSTKLPIAMLLVSGAMVVILIWVCLQPPWEFREKNPPLDRTVGLGHVASLRTKYERKR